MQEEADKDKSQEAPAAAAKVNAPAVAAAPKPEVSVELLTALQRLVASGRSATLLLQVSGVDTDSANVNILSEDGQLVGQYEITKTGIKSL